MILSVSWSVLAIVGLVLLGLGIFALLACAGALGRLVEIFQGAKMTHAASVDHHSGKEPIQPGEEIRLASGKLQ
jgi:hypothetical protein